MARKRKFNKGISRLIRNNFPKIIDAIKEGNETGGDGSDKLESAAKFLNKHVDIPMLPEYLEEMLFKFVLGELSSDQQFLRLRACCTYGVYGDIHFKN